MPTLTPTLPNLTLSGVPASLIVGVETTTTRVNNTDTRSHNWAIGVDPAVGLTISQIEGELGKNNGQAITITPIVAGHYTITLTSTSGAAVSGPVKAVALDPAVHRYRELLADLETLKF